VNPISQFKNKKKFSSLEERSGKRVYQASGDLSYSKNTTHKIGRIHYSRLERKKTTSRFVKRMELSGEEEGIPDSDLHTRTSFV
jgi:hypothetical protein